MMKLFHFHPVKMNEGDLGRLAEHLCEGLGREGRHRVGRCLVLNSRILRLQEQCWVNSIISVAYFYEVNEGINSFSGIAILHSEI